MHSAARHGVDQQLMLQRYARRECILRKHCREVPTGAVTGHCHTGDVCVQVGSASADDVLQDVQTVVRRGGKLVQRGLVQRETCAAGPSGNRGRQRYISLLQRA